MIFNKYKIFIAFTAVLIVGFIPQKNTWSDKILFHVVDPWTQDIQFFRSDEKGLLLRSIQNLKTYVEGNNRILTFAMNGGMYNKDHTPVGLFIQNNITIAPLNKSEGSGNFFLKPNGVFYITANNVPAICKTENFEDNGKIKFATQSGPMLVVDNQIHQAFKEGSKNLNIRNGVGILPNNKILFAISKTEINLYDFAKYFLDMGCKNALYLDGSVSRAYLPEKNWIQLDGDFGVMIGVTE